MAGYSVQGELFENQLFPAFLTQIYQWFTNISGGPGLAIMIFEMKNVVGK